MARLTGDIAIWVGTGINEARSTRREIQLEVLVIVKIMAIDRNSRIPFIAFLKMVSAMAGLV
ncbi:hypothetical protein [Mycolicibacterium iranicum]|uniref:Uncharacterized protein n=1 Tax=Mycolicibacterium iranicum TaxID=912594 RepID=A0A178LV30_MYCIR|nr:hypothetical protein [Mycolicibacterium iranicum]OAN38113.1 hypothetical protein A4X20_19905 [Mycolicibacterium iranicum]